MRAILTVLITCIGFVSTQFAHGQLVIEGIQDSDATSRIVGSFTIPNSDRGHDSLRSLGIYGSTLFYNKETAAFALNSAATNAWGRRYLSSTVQALTNIRVTLNESIPTLTLARILPTDSLAENSINTVTLSGPGDSGRIVIGRVNGTDVTESTINIDHQIQLEPGVKAALRSVSGQTLIKVVYDGGELELKVEELPTDLVPVSLTWNPLKGGIDASVTINGPLSTETDLKFYWAKGTPTSPIILNSEKPIDIQKISAGSTGFLSSFHVEGNKLRGAPDGTTQICMVIDSDELISEENDENNAEQNNFMCLKDVEILYGSGQPAPNYKLSVLTKSVIKEALRFAGQGEGWVTSTYRSERRQSEVMFDVLEGPVKENMGKAKSTVQYSRRLYGDKGKQVIDAYVEARRDYREKLTKNRKKLTKKQKEDRREKILTKMTKAIRQAKKDYPGAFPHTSDPSKLQVIDIAANLISNHTLFEEAISIDPRITRHFSPLTNPTDVAFHLEIRQPETSSPNPITWVAHARNFDNDVTPSFDATLIMPFSVINPSRPRLYGRFATPAVFKGVFGSQGTNLWATSASAIHDDRWRSVVIVNQADGLKYRAITVSKASGTAEQRSVVEVSSNLIEWYSGDSHTTIILNNGKLLKVRDNTPITSGAKRYIRLKPQTR